MENGSGDRGKNPMTHKFGTYGVASKASLFTKDAKHGQPAGSKKSSEAYQGGGTHSPAMKKGKNFSSNGKNSLG